MGEVVKFKPRSQFDEDGIEIVRPGTLEMVVRWLVFLWIIGGAALVIWSIPAMVTEGAHLVAGWFGLE